METTQSLVIKIVEPTKHKRFWLEAMSQAFTDAVQYCLDDAQQTRDRSRGAIHKSCYYEVRDGFGLPSVYTRMVINKSVSMVRLYYALLKSKYQKKTSFPKARKSQGIGLGADGYALVENGERWVLRCSTGIRGQYIWLPLCVPKKYRHLMEIAGGDALLFERDGDWYVMLPVRVDSETPSARGGERSFIGVDLGIVRLATVAYPDRVEFFSGEEARHKREHFSDVRGRYQRHDRKDKTRDSRHKESAWMRDMNHKISKSIVAGAAKYPRPVIVLENLEGISRRLRSSRRFNRMMSSWAFRQLCSFIEYKAQRCGIPVIYVDPRDTSKTCSRCGHCSRSNRPDQSHFVCEACGYQVNADVNASFNIAARGLYTYGQEPPDTARSQDQTGFVPPDVASADADSLPRQTTTSTFPVGASPL